MENHRAVQLLCQMYLPHFDKQEKEAITTAIEILQKFDWVDVNEELPKKSGDYLVTCNDGNIHIWLKFWIVQQEMAVMPIIGNILMNIFFLILSF